MSDPSIRGRFVWHELMTTDQKSAATFLSRLTGWKTSPWPGDASYTICAVGSRQVAGILALPEAAKQMGARPSWLTHIATPNVDESAKLAASLGAKILRAPADVPTVGRFAVLEDPQGATFALYTPNNPSPDAALDEGEFSWHELATTDWRAALTFYQRLFGWEETSAMDMGPDGTYQMFGRNGRPLGGIFNKSSRTPGPASWLPYVRVSDAKAAAAMVKKLGGQVINGPMEVPGGDWIAQGLDLQGATFAVHSVKPAAKKPVAKKRAVAKTAARRQAAKKVAAKKSAVKKSTAKASPAKKIVAKRPVAKKSVAKKSGRKGRAKQV